MAFPPLRGGAREISQGRRLPAVIRAVLGGGHRRGDRHAGAAGDACDRSAPIPKRTRCKTPSGKIEIYSERIASFGYDDCPPHAAWLEPIEWLGGEIAKRYPLHMLSDQPADKLHSQLDHGPHSRATKVKGRQPITLHPDDAATRGIAEGDVVRVFNDRGACLAAARLSDRIRPQRRPAQHRRVVRSG